MMFNLKYHPYSYKISLRMCAYGKEYCFRYRYYFKQGI